MGGPQLQVLSLKGYDPLVSRTPRLGSAAPVKNTRREERTTDAETWYADLKSMEGDSPTPHWAYRKSNSLIGLSPA